VRWLVLAMLFIVTTINFADRATISIAGADIRKAFGLSPVQMGYIFSAFAWSYVLAQLPGGWLLDRFGSKTTYVCALTLWSLFTMLQGTVGFLTGGAAAAVLFLLRLAVGAAEARRSRATAASRRRGFRRTSGGWRRRSSTPRSTSPRPCSRPSWAGSSTRTAGRPCSM